MKLIVTSFSMQQKHSAPGMVLTSNTALLCLYLIQQWFIFLPKLRQCLGSVLSSQWTGYNAVVTAPWKMTHSNSVKFFISLYRSFILARSFITLDSFELGSEVDEWRPGDPILYQEPLIFLTITPWLLIGFYSLLSLHNTLFEVNQRAQTSTITHQSWDGSWQPAGWSPLTFRMQKLECVLPSPSLQVHSALKMTDFSSTHVKICCSAIPLACCTNLLDQLAVGEFQMTSCRSICRCLRLRNADWGSLSCDAWLDASFSFSLFRNVKLSLQAANFTFSWAKLNC